MPTWVFVGGYPSRHLLPCGRENRAWYFLCYEKRTRWNGCVGDADVNLDCLVVVAPFAEITITDATFRFAIDVHAAAAV